MRFGPQGRYRATKEGFLDWVEDCREIVRGDDDNLILFSGPTGVGKSTIALQVLSLLDPEGFSIDRIHFKLGAFMEAADRTPKYGALLADEFLANRRKAMHAEIVELNDFFQYCRYLNLQMGICFPNPERLDRPILEDRVKWHVEVIRRGHFRLWQKVVTYQRVKGGMVSRVIFWKERGAWYFRDNAGAFRDAYESKKALHMRSRGIDVDAQPEQAPAVDSFSSVGFDWNALRDDFADRSRDEDPQAPTPSAAL